MGIVAPPRLINGALVPKTQETFSDFTGLLQQLFETCPPSNNHSGPPCRGKLMNMVFQQPTFHCHDCFRGCNDLWRSRARRTLPKNKLCLALLQAWCGYLIWTPVQKEGVRPPPGLPHTKAFGLLPGGLESGRCLNLHRWRRREFAFAPVAGVRGPGEAGDSAG